MSVAQQHITSHSGHLQNNSGLFTISSLACCMSHKASRLPMVMSHRAGPPMDGVKTASTPALWPCTC